jgi:hypothetical protein
MEIDARFTSGHANKLLAPTASKNLGPRSLGPLLGALGIKLVDHRRFVSVPQKLEFVERRKSRAI